jgi:putative transposase
VETILIYAEGGGPMPRQARLDIPGLVHHVMARGIEGRDIFTNKADHEEFLQRLADILSGNGGPTLYAWALLSNHFHLLIRPAEIHLSTIMQRLMTGYALNFNKHHRRIGHLFQNRYKSIVVEEDLYFLELVRYIHLNPLRAGMVNSLEALEKYTYTGHGVILGKREYPIQNVEYVLSCFSSKRESALEAYRAFVEAGAKQGVREDLRGGGLIRSAGGVVALLARNSDEHEAADERILGNGYFVESVLNARTTVHGSSCLRVDAILKEVSEHSGISVEQILGQSKACIVSKARLEFFRRAQNETGITVTELGRITGRTHVAVVRALR